MLAQILVIINLQLCALANGHPNKLAVVFNFYDESLANRLRQVIRSHTDKGQQMNWDRIEGNWKQLKGNAKQQWGKLTDDQLNVIAGKREHLAGKIQEVYGHTKDDVENQISAWQKAQLNANLISNEKTSSNY